MTRPKYKQGKQICSISEFNACENLWYKWNGKTVHRSVLISLQYRTLLNAIRLGLIYKAIPIRNDYDDDPSHPFAEDVLMKY